MLRSKCHIAVCKRSRRCSLSLHPSRSRARDWWAEIAGSQLDWSEKCPAAKSSQNGVPARATTRPMVASTVPALCSNATHKLCHAVSPPVGRSTTSRCSSLPLLPSSLAASLLPPPPSLPPPPVPWPFKTHHCNVQLCWAQWRNSAGPGPSQLRFHHHPVARRPSKHPSSTHAHTPPWPPTPGGTR